MTNKPNTSPALAAALRRSARLLTPPQMTMQPVSWPNIVCTMTLMPPSAWRCLVARTAWR